MFFKSFINFEKLIFLKFIKKPFNYIYNLFVPIILLIIYYFVEKNNSNGSDFSGNLAILVPGVFLLSSISIAGVSCSYELMYTKIRKINKIYATTGINYFQYLIVVFIFYFSFYILILVLSLFITNSAMGINYSSDQLLTIFFLCIFSFPLNFFISLSILRYTKTEKSSYVAILAWFFISLLLSGVILPFIYANKDNYEWFRWIQLIANPSGSFLYFIEAFIQQTLDWTIDWLFLIFPLLEVLIISSIVLFKTSWI